MRCDVIGDMVMTMTPSTLPVLDRDLAEPPTLAADLAHDRLLQRLARLDRVIAALHTRARAYEAACVPRPLRISLTEFEAERAAVKAGLEAHVTASTPGGAR